MSGRILIVSASCSPPAACAGSARMLALGRVLQSAGWAVHFLLCTPARPDPRQQAAMEACWDYLHVAPVIPMHPAPTGPHRLDDWCLPALAGRVAELHRNWRFNAVICHTLWLSLALTELGDHVVKLLDTPLVFSGRDERLRAAGLSPTGFATSVTDEMRGLARADIVLALTEQEAALFRARGHPDVRVVGHVSGLRARLVREHSVLTAGYLAGADPFNVATLNKFRCHMPRAPRDLRVIVAGTLSAAPSQTAPFTALGPLSDAAAFYDAVDMVLNPADIDVGLQIKSVEAISNGLPFVATRPAMAGLPSYHALHRLDGAEELAACLRDTRFGVTLRRELATASRRAARDYAASVRAAVRSLLDVF